jgi:hypothetical protein
MLYSRLSPGGLTFGFAMLALLVAVASALPAALGFGSLACWVRGPGDLGLAAARTLGLGGLVWITTVGALGGAVTAWIYNAVVPTRAAERDE